MSLRCSSHKVRHPRGKAEAALRSLQKQLDYRGSVYPCVLCGGFHVGRLKDKAHRSRYAVMPGDGRIARVR